ncbi:MAG: hypothetical protein JWP38_3513 [Herbaspirillum sp.]|jgi:hypothetical protein|nr:hypothetical protein [Herbaspirillum sp.]
MATSTLDPDLIRGKDRQLGVGHDNDRLGPGDTSDSGSDMSGVANADTDSDSHLTGERMSTDLDNDRDSDSDDADADWAESSGGDDDDYDDSVPDDEEIDLDTTADDSAIND